MVSGCQNIDKIEFLSIWSNIDWNHNKVWHEYHPYTPHSWTRFSLECIPFHEIHLLQQARVVDLPKKRLGIIAFLLRASKKGFQSLPSPFFFRNQIIYHLLTIIMLLHNIDPMIRQIGNIVDNHTERYLDQIFVQFTTKGTAKPFGTAEWQGSTDK